MDILAKRLMKIAKELAGQDRWAYSLEDAEKIIDVKGIEASLGLQLAAESAMYDDIGEEVTWEKKDDDEYICHIRFKFKEGLPEWVDIECLFEYGQKYGPFVMVQNCRFSNGAGGDYGVHLCEGIGLTGNVEVDSRRFGKVMDKVVEKIGDEVSKIGSETVGDWLEHDFWVRRGGFLGKKDKDMVKKYVDDVLKSLHVDDGTLLYRLGYDIVGWLEEYAIDYVFGKKVPNPPFKQIDLDEDRFKGYF